MNWSRHPVDSHDGDGRAPGKIDQAEPRLWSRAEGGKQKRRRKRIKVSVAAKGEAPRVWNKGVSRAQLCATSAQIVVLARIVLGLCYRELEVA